MSRTLCYQALVVAGILAATGIASGDSLYSKRVSDRGTLVSDQKVRFREGDIITVMVREAVDAQTESELETERKTKNEGTAAESANAFLTGSGPLGLFSENTLPNWSIDVKNKSESDGSTRRKNSLTMTVGCTVTHVYPNGNILVEGQKRVTVNREDSLLVVSGLVRARDVTAENLVDSNLMANAVIELTGHGPLWNNQRRGFFTKMFDWISPF